MGKKLDALGKIIGGVISGFSLPKSIDDNRVSIELSILKKTAPVTINGNVIVNKAETTEGRVISQRIMESTDLLLDKGDRAIEADFSKLIAGAREAVIPSSDDEALLGRFVKFVPATDLPIIRAALFVRRLGQNKGDVQRYKQLIYQSYLSRGNNICNLVSAGYYEDYLESFYEHLVDTEGNEQAMLIFNDFYEEAVTQYNFAVFVGIAKTYDQLKSEITTKVQLNLLNNQHTLNIHGIGKTNKRMIARLIDDEDISRSYMADPDIVQLENTFYARLYF